MRTATQSCWSRSVVFTSQGLDRYRSEAIRGVSEPLSVADHHAIIMGRLRLTLRYEWRVVKATTATHAPQRRDHGIQVGRSGEPDENSGAISLENRFDVCSSLMDAVALRFPHRVLDRAGHRSQLHGA